MTLKIEDLDMDKVWVQRADGQSFELAIEEAATQDEPEGSLTITVSAKLYSWLRTKQRSQRGE